MKTPEQMALEHEQSKLPGEAIYVPEGTDTRPGTINAVNGKPEPGGIIQPGHTPSLNAPVNNPSQETKAKALVLVGSEVRPLIMTDMDTGWRMATAFALSRMLPKSYYSDGQEAAPAKAFAAMQLGAEVGLPPMQSIQSIAVVNGLATIWGDTQKALVERSGEAEYIRESYEGGELYGADGKLNPNFKAVCETKRKGRDAVREEFSQADAQRAGLWGKSGPWTTHPKRMMRYKVRAFALRDVYPDVLKGLTHSAEEMEGEPVMTDVTPQRSQALDLIAESPSDKLSGKLAASMVEPATPQAQAVAEVTGKGDALRDLPLYLQRGVADGKENSA